ncbi:Modulator of FtsH protease HflK [Anoxybacillus sp. BCO1]|nr:Modulator of FtsH protease HflK [Anoxybacillus sp. BCO1]
MARIEKAYGDVAKFNALYEEYKNAKDITKQRLMIETLEQVLPYTRIYIMNDDGNTLKYLPIQPIEKQTTEKKTEKGSGNE